MPKVLVKKDESIDRAIRRFRKQCKRENLINEVKKRMRYIKPSQQRRSRLSRAKRKRSSG